MNFETSRFIERRLTLEVGPYLEAGIVVSLARMLRYPSPVIIRVRHDKVLFDILGNALGSVHV
jgi:hypothetical protein